MSWKQSPAYRQAYAKKDAIRVADALNKAGIDCEIEAPVPNGETNLRGLPKGYFVDVTVIDRDFFKVGIEMDGRTHAGREEDDMEKDAWLKANAGYKEILHFPNKTPTDKIMLAIQTYRKNYGGSV